MEIARKEYDTAEIIRDNRLGMSLILSVSRSVDSIMRYSKLEVRHMNGDLLGFSQIFQDLTNSAEVPASHGISLLGTINLKTQGKAMDILNDDYITPFLGNRIYHPKVGLRGVGRIVLHETIK